MVKEYFYWNFVIFPSHNTIISNLFIILLIKYFIALLTFNPVLAEILKKQSNPLNSENSSNSCVLSISFLSKRSALFSTKIQGILSPSRNISVLSIESFHFKVL